MLTDGAPAEGAAAAAQTFSWSTLDAQSVSSSTRYVFTGDDNPVTVSFSNLTVAAASGNRTVSPSVTFSSALASGYSYTLTLNLEASRGDYYSYASAYGTAYECTIPLSEAYTYIDASGNTQSTNSLTFLRYNLGADPSLTVKQQMKYTYSDTKNIRVYGGLWQWGRKDVGHSLRDNVDEAPSYFHDGQYDSYDPSTNTQFCINVPGASESATTANWLSTDVVASNLWGNGMGTSGERAFNQNSGTPNATANANNPCPSGYRVPTRFEWLLFRSFFGEDVYPTWYVPEYNSSIVVVRVINGYAETYESGLWTDLKVAGWVIYDKSAIGDGNGTDAEYNAAFAEGTDLTAESAPEPLMFLPAAGARDGDDGGLVSVSTEGLYWSSTYDKNGHSYMFRMHNGGSYTSHNYRARGFSVRCVKDL